MRHATWWRRFEDMVKLRDRAEQERDEARAVARDAVAAWQWHQAAGRPPGYGYDEGEIMDLKRQHPWLADG